MGFNPKYAIENLLHVETPSKKFTLAEKLLILSEGKKNEVKKSLDKYALYPENYYYWKKKLAVYGEAGLEHKKSKEDKQLTKDLEKQNEVLKILLAEKELSSLRSIIHILYISKIR